MNQVYLDLLAASEEASIKEGLMGMGTAADVPKLFRAIGRVSMVRGLGFSAADVPKLFRVRGLC